MSVDAHNIAPHEADALEAHLEVGNQGTAAQQLGADANRVDELTTDYERRVTPLTRRQKLAAGIAGLAVIGAVGAGVGYGASHHGHSDSYPVTNSQYR